MDMLISVVIPIYNQEKYLRECLDSLFPQCTEEVQVVLVDDGSKDRSREICRQYLKDHPGVNAVLIEQENSGSLRSRVNGVSKASGDYILFMDSDDMLLDHALETLLETLHKKSYDMVLFNATSDLVSYKPVFDIPLEDGKEIKGEDKRQVYRLLCCTHVLNNLWTKCIRKELYQKASLPEEGQRLTNGEDLFQILDMVDQAKTFIYLDKTFYFYRVMQDSISRIYNPYYFQSEKIVCAKRLEYAQKWGKDEDLVSGAEVQTYKIMREIARKVLISDMKWRDAKNEMKKLRGDAFFRKYYLEYEDAPDNKYPVLKAPYGIMHIARILRRIKKGLGK
jgi:glycosyltransferase involved in cell wall biosynthesis